MAAQVLGLQAGYAYASTIDPNTQADSGILLVLGADRGSGCCSSPWDWIARCSRLFAESLERIPAGTFTFQRGLGGSG